MARRRGASKIEYALLAADCIIRSLGINPAKGGKPPNERRLNAAISPVVSLLFMNRSVRDLIWFLLNIVTRGIIINQ